MTKLVSMVNNEDMMAAEEFAKLLKMLPMPEKERFYCVMLGASMMAELMEQPPEPPEEKKVG